MEQYSLSVVKNDENHHLIGKTVKYKYRGHMLSGVIGVVYGVHPNGHMNIFDVNNLREPFVVTVLVSEAGKQYVVSPADNWITWI